MSLHHQFFSLFCRTLCMILKINNKIFRHRKRVLLVKMDGVGDMLLFLPYLKVIQQECEARSHELIFVVTPVSAALLRRIGIHGKVIIPPPYKGFLQRAFFRFCFYFRNYADIVIKAQCLPSELIECYPSAQVISCGIRSLDRECSIDISGKSVYQWNEAILKQLGISGFRTAAIEYSIFCDPLPAGNILPEKYIVICPDASDLHRCWETEKFARLITVLYQKYSCGIILIGRDVRRGKVLQKMCACPDVVMDWTGKTDIFQLFTVVKNALFLVSNDTGTAHIGALTGTKTFIICGKGHYGMFVPYPPDKEGTLVFSIFSRGECSNCNWLASCIDMKSEETYRCIAEISVDDVITTICENYG